MFSHLSDCLSNLHEINIIIYFLLYKNVLYNNEVKHFGHFVWLPHEWSYSTYTWQSSFYPRVTSILCKSGFCAVLDLRANYILVSFSEYHPDKHYTWLPFPAAQCNPSLQNRKKRRRKRGNGGREGREEKKKEARGVQEKKVYTAVIKT